MTKRPWEVRSSVEGGVGPERIREKLKEMDRFGPITTSVYGDDADETGIECPLNIGMYNPAIVFIDEMISKGKTLCIYGDMDFDGMSSTAILYMCIKTAYPNADLRYLIPTRDDGHGVDVGLVEKSSPVPLTDLAIITVDNGISSGMAIRDLMSKGCEVCVTDHHLPGDETPECIIVDPKLAWSLTPDNPEYEVPGAYVAAKIGLHLIPFEDEGPSMDLVVAMRIYVAMAIVSDNISLLSPIILEQLHVGLIDINFVQYKHNPYTLGVEELLRKCGAKGNHPITTRLLSYSVIPKLNSAGRMNVPHKGVDLLISKDMGSVMNLVDELLDLNTTRKDIEEAIYIQIQPVIENLLRKYPNSVVININEVVKDEALLVYAPGVVGIIASRIADAYGVPTLVMHESGELVKGSGRTVGDFDLYAALVESSEYLTGFGGHKNAAGARLLLSNFNAFQEKFNNVVSDNLPGPTPITVDIDGITIVDLQSVCTQVDLSLIEPIGNGNNPLILKLNNLVVVHTEYKDDRYVLSIIFKDELDNTMVCRKFKPEQSWLKTKVGMEYDILVTPSVLYFNQVTSVDWGIIDLKPSARR